MIKIIREFESLLVDFVDLDSIYPSVVVCHCFWWGNETHHNGNPKETWSCCCQGHVCQICVAEGQSGFISCQGFLHFVRNCEKENSSKCVSILWYLGLGESIVRLFESVLILWNTETNKTWEWYVHESKLREI